MIAHEGPWLTLRSSKANPGKNLEMTGHSTAPTDVPRSKNRGLKQSFFVSVPKRIVKLATQRNRIKRLVREAVRKDPYFDRQGFVFELKVTAAPKAPGLSEVKDLIERAKKVC